MGTDAGAVVDASILPRTVTGNLNATVIMLAEKLTDRILGNPPLPAEAVDWYRCP